MMVDADRINNMLDEIVYWKNRALKAEFDAMHDSMTGCLNRAGMYAAAAHSNYRYVYVIDINGLKQVNDSRGHEAGDQYILDVVSMIKSRLNSGAILARVGGDEFVILSHHILVGFVRTTAYCFGFAYCSDPAKLDEVLKTADARMYLRKKARKNQPPKNF